MFDHLLKAQESILAANRLLATDKRCLELSDDFLDISISISRLILKIVDND